MSDHVRTPLCATQDVNSTNDMLERIIAAYVRRYKIDEELQKVAMYDLVAEGLSQASGIKVWQWRYIQSVRAGTLEPSRYLSVAIRKLDRKLETARHRAKTVTYPHVTLRKDDPVSAVKTLRKKVDPAVLAEIVKLLLADGLEMEY